MRRRSQPPRPSERIVFRIAFGGIALLLILGAIAILDISRTSKHQSCVEIGRVLNFGCRE